MICRGGLGVSSSMPHFTCMNFKPLRFLNSSIIQLKGSKLLEKKELVVLNKIDLIDEDTAKDLINHFSINENKIDVKKQINDYFVLNNIF